MKISLVFVGLGIVLLVIPTGKTMDHYDGLGFVCFGLILVGLGGVLAIGELAGLPLSRKSHSDDPENEAVDSGKPEAEKAEKTKLSWGSWVALGVFGLIACLIVFFIISFLMWLPGPI